MAGQVRRHSLSRRWLLALSVLGTLLLVVGYFLRDEGGPARHFEFVRSIQARGAVVEARVFDELVIYENELGTFTVPSRCPGLGVAYISRWVLPDGRVMSADQFNLGSGTSSAQGYLNDPRQGGLFAFSAYAIPSGAPPPWQYHDLAWGPPPDNWSTFTSTRRCARTGVAWVDPRQITRTSYEQGVCLMRGCKVKVWQRLDFGADVVRSRVTVELRPGVSYLKEPEVGVNLNGEAAAVEAISTPGVPNPYKGGCRVYTGLSNPMSRTGRCEHPDRRVVRLSPQLRLDIDDLDWRTLADRAQQWPRAGDQDCPGWTGFRIHDNWEFPVWGRDVSVLVKGWEGCVTGLDFSHGFRRVTSTKRAIVTISISR